MQHGKRLLPPCVQASIADLDILAPLFDGYRQFYGRASEPEREFATFCGIVWS